jgi:hypothetical protein
MAGATTPPRNTAGWQRSITTRDFSGRATSPARALFLDRLRTSALRRNKKRMQDSSLGIRKQICCHRKWCFFYDLPRRTRRAIRPDDHGDRSRLREDDLSPFFDLICEYNGAAHDRSPEFFDRFEPYLSMTQLALCPRNLNAKRARRLPKW